MRRWPTSPVIPGRVEGADPESRRRHSARFWIPGSRAAHAPRNDSGETMRAEKERVTP
jgi:hypothetical protein